MSVKLKQVTVDALAPADFAAWRHLARGYKAFYRTELPDAAFALAWRRLAEADRLFAWAARVDSQLVGIVHFLFHPSTWSDDVCYLQDLFVDEGSRGQGIGGMLIARVAQSARERGASRLYWLTHTSNVHARQLKT